MHLHASYEGYNFLLSAKDSSRHMTSPLPSRTRLFIFFKVIFKKLIFKFSCIFLLLEKLVNGKYFPVNEKHFPVKGKFGLIFRKVFSFYFKRKTLSESCEKFKNIILFTDYIKFGPQNFNCYLYFVLNIYFSISSLIV